MGLSSHNRHGNEAPGEPEPPQKPGGEHAEAYEGESAAEQGLTGRMRTRACALAAVPYLVVALVVGDALRVLLVEVEAVLHQELHRLRLHDVLLRAEQRQVVHLAQVRVLGLRREQRLRAPRTHPRELGAARRGHTQHRAPAPLPVPSGHPRYLAGELPEAGDAQGEHGARPGGAAHGSVPLLDAPAGGGRLLPGPGAPKRRRGGAGLGGARG